jgi:hypothetical protein
MKHNSHEEGLLEAEELLKVIWPNPKCRPSLRWLRQLQKDRKVPYIKIGHLVFFNPAKVREAIEKCTVKAL